MLSYDWQNCYCMLGRMSCYPVLFAWQNVIGWSLQFQQSVIDRWIKQLLVCCFYTCMYLCYTLDRCEIVTLRKCYIVEKCESVSHNKTEKATCFRSKLLWFIFFFHSCHLVKVYWCLTEMSESFNKILCGVQIPSSIFIVCLDSLLGVKLYSAKLSLTATLWKA